MTSIVSRPVVPARPLAIALAVASVFSSSFAFAQATKDTALAPVVVTAARIAQPQADALPHTTVITAEDIRNRQAIDLPSLLRQEAGISISQSGGPGTLASLFLRGASPAQTLILLDGVPLRKQDFTSQAAIEHISPDQIERIEIVRGNVSAIYGSDAIGGVIQIFTKRGNGTPSFGVTVEAGSRNTAKLCVDGSTRIGNTNFAISASRFKTSGFSANNTSKFSNENPDRDGYRNNSVATSLSNEWAKDQEIGFRLYANEGRTDSDGAGFGTSTQIDQSQSRQESYALFSRNRVNQHWTSTATVAQVQSRGGFETIGGSFPSSASFDSYTTRFDWANEVSLGSAWVLSAGASAADEKAKVAFGGSANRYSRSATGMFVGLNGKVDRHQLQGNLRYDRIGGSGSDTTGFLGYGYQLISTLKLIANASTGFHAPTLVQRFNISSGNPDLRAERSRSMEIGAQYSKAETLVRATLFKTRITDQFGTDLNNCSPTACPTVNIDRTDNTGFELSTSTRVADTDLKASLTFQHPRDRSIDKSLVQRPKKSIALMANRSIGAWRIGGDIQHVGKRRDQDFNTFSDVNLGSYSLVNVNARYQVNKDWSLFGRVDNLLNRDYETAYGYNQPPRGIFVGVNWQH